MQKNNSNKPVIIGVSSEVINPDKGWGSTWSVGRGYVDIVRKAGALAVILPSIEEDLEAYLSIVDGVVSIGGRDIPLELYGQKPEVEGMRFMDMGRARFEVALAKKAVELDKPYLGICGGLQALNVAMGGTLIQDIDHSYGKTLKHRAVGDAPPEKHMIDIVASSKLGDLAAVDCPEMITEVNSFHHQSVNKAGDGLAVTATAEEGVVEAVEHTLKKFVVGVQWHPERSPDHFLTLTLAENLVKTCENNRRG